jgi:hypothetical protein
VPAAASVAAATAIFIVRFISSLLSLPAKHEASAKTVAIHAVRGNWTLAVSIASRHVFRILMASSTVLDVRQFPFIRTRQPVAAAVKEVAVAAWQHGAFMECDR